jgi:hypothetical protein
MSSTASDLPPAIVKLIEEAIIATSLTAGALPEQIDAVPAFMAEWCRLIRRHDCRLLGFTDYELEAFIRGFGN